MSLTLKEAVAIASAMPTEAIGSISAARASEVVSAFGTVVELQLKAAALLKSRDYSKGLVCPDKDVVKGQVPAGYGLSESEAAAIVAASDIYKSVLALKNGKAAAVNTLTTAVATIAGAALQNPGDNFVIPLAGCEVILRQVTNTFIKYDSAAIVKEAGATLTKTVVNTALEKCFKDAKAPAINPFGVEDCIKSGALDAKYRSTTSSTDVIITVVANERKENN